MKVFLHSNDLRVKTAVQAVINELNPAFSLNDGPAPIDGILLWDYEPGDAIPTPSDKCAGRLIFLARRQHLAQLQDEVCGAAVRILLKPLNDVALKAMLIQARDAACDSPSRLDLLQYTLQANLKLQEYDQDRTNFLARAVHDFRAPLTALHGYCGLLLQQQLGPVNPAQTELLQRMQHSVKRLSRMAAAMFELSVGKHVERKPRFEPVDINQCVEQALHDVIPLADEKQIEVSVKLERPGMRPRWESAQVEQVLVNLFENACKFTPRFGAIDIRGYETAIHAAQRGDETSDAASPARIPAYRIDVHDTGPGIEREFLPLIFEEYTSYSGGKDRSGGGLGLAICRMIVAAHGGKIWAETSERGATFSFALPFNDPMLQSNGSHSKARAAGAIA